MFPVRNKATDVMFRYTSGSKQPEMLTMPDDIATIDVKHSFLAGIRQVEN